MHFVMVGSTAPSHVYPSLALIAELVTRGHRVSYVIGDRLTALVAATGAELSRRRARRGGSAQGRRGSRV